MYSCAKGVDDKYGWHLHLPMNDGCTKGMDDTYVCHLRIGMYGCTKGMDDTYFTGFVIPQVVRYPVSGI